MGGRGQGSILLVAVVAAVIGIATLATVGLLPGQVTNASVSRASATATTLPFALGTGVPTPSVPPGAAPTAVTTTSTPAPLTPSTTTTIVAADDTAGQSSTTTEPAAAPSGGGTSATTPTTAAPSSEDTTTTTARASTPPANVNASDPTCSILQELLDMVDDPAVRQAIRDEMRDSGC